MIKSSFLRTLLVAIVIVIVTLPRPTQSQSQSQSQTNTSSANDNETTTSIAITTRPTELIVNCTLCPDGSFPNDPSARADFGDSILTCEQVYDLGGTLFLSETNCTFLQSIGTGICACPEDNDDDATTTTTTTTTILDNSNCTLCPNGQSLSQPLKESFPGISCAQMQVNAKRDTEITCTTYQTVVGHYCGCNEDPEDQDDNIDLNTTCRLCGFNVDLPNPQLSISVEIDDGTNSTTTTTTTVSSSCMELEFEANRDSATSNNNANCNFFTAMYSPICCAGTPSPTPILTTAISSASRHSHHSHPLLHATTLLLLLLLLISLSA